MRYEWDESKRVANLAKHGVDFADAERFDWSTAMEAEDNRLEYGEKRWIALGRIGRRFHVLHRERRQHPPDQPAQGQQPREGIL